MKKICLFLAVLTAAVLMTGCKGSDTADKTAAETTEYVTQAYSIPEGATGPADVTVAPRTDYPEDKKPGDTSGVIQVRYFYINSRGLNEEFDVIEGAERNAEELNKLLIRCGVVADGTEVLSFESDGSNGILKLNALEGASSYATEELLAQALANTYTDNLALDTLTIKVGDKTYGPLSFDSGKKQE